MSAARPGSGAFRIDREGAWRHDGAEITHPGVVANLWANLRVDEGGHHLAIGPRRIPVAVDDAPFVVVRTEVTEADATGEARLTLSDGTVEALVPEAVWLTADGTPYCRVKEGRFVARFAVAAWIQLAQALEEEPGTGRVVLRLGGRQVPVEVRR